MKKLISLLLALTMLCCLASAVAEDAVVYYLHSAVMDGVEVNAADLGLSMTLTLNPDGTAVLESSMTDDPTQGTWVSDETTVTITADGSDVVFTMTDNGLEADSDGTTLIFTTEAPVSVNLGTAMAASDLAAFNGTWNCTYISMGGMNMPASTMSGSWEILFGTTDTTIVVADGVVTVCGGTPMTYTFADGKLTYSVEDNELSGETIELTDAGYLVYTMETMSLALYCEPVAQ